MKLTMLLTVLAGALCSGLSAATPWDSGDPSPSEQYVLELINRARANPAAEGTRLGLDIAEGLTQSQAAEIVLPKPPLAMNKTLLSVARAHSQDMYDRAFFAHTNPDNKDPFDRMSNAGYSYGAAGENIAAGGSATAAFLADLLMIDKNYPGRGHRTNLLGVETAAFFTEVGIGYYSGPSVKPVGTFNAKDFITQDFGSSNTQPGPFAVGVVYTDTNGNGFYDIGEGIAGVTATPSAGSFTAVSASAGGFAFPISTATSGSIIVTFSGGPLTEPITRTVSLNGKSQKVDLLVTAGGGDGGSGGGNGGGGGGGNGGGSGSSGTAMDTDSDGFPDEMEDFMGTSKTDANSTPLGGSPAGTPQALVLTKLQASLNFLKPLGDSLQLAGTLQVPSGFTVLNQKVVLDVGGVMKSFMLDAKGMSTPKSTTESFKLRVKAKKGVVEAQQSAFQAKVLKSDLDASLADEGLTNADAAQKAVTVPVRMFFNSQMFSADSARTYTAKAGKTGKAK